MQHRRKKSFLVALAAGFTMFWAIFLMNEYKISILRNPNYHMLFWIWLGLANSTVKTIHAELSNRSINASSSPDSSAGTAIPLNSPNRNADKNTSPFTGDNIRAGRNPR
jgi:hypothetical protein